MQPLNLPSCALNIKQEEGNSFVFDIIRKKYVVLTSEEWVRQHFIHLMINHLQYPKPLITVESGLSYFKSAKRSDITVKKRDGHNFLLVECKAPEVKIDQQSLNQISVYNKNLQADYIAMTNGLKHYIWRLLPEKDKYEQLGAFPPFTF